jgi:hypothetical protein
MRPLSERGRKDTERENAVADSLTALLATLGWPAPIPEYRFAPPRRWRFDYAWPDHRLALEIEGGTWTGGRHVRARGYERDCEKYSEAALRGWCVLRVTSAMLRDGRALALLQRALENRKTGATTDLDATSR